MTDSIKRHEELACQEKGGRNHQAAEEELNLLVSDKDLHPVLKN